MASPGKNWQKWFAWYPVRLHSQGRWAWLKTVYRTPKLSWYGQDRIGGYRYTDLFGLLKL